ncbi:outer membrane protein [Helicobacter cetorum]|uniref:outer membrane protein n=1 Tax=Helicobacter cetorum TaxID=138563 RepID=UPI000CF1B88A|nr:outer membrane protein [Helicobacter cetorum]
MQSHTQQHNNTTTQQHNNTTILTRLNSSLPKTFFAFTLGSLLSANTLIAEENGWFFGISYETSYAKQNIKNPGANIASELRKTISSSVTKNHKSVTPLTYMAQIIGENTKALMQAICPGASDKNPCTNGASKSGPTFAPYNPTNLNNALTALNTLISESQKNANDPNFSPTTILNNQTLDAQQIANIVLNDVNSAIATLMYNQSASGAMNGNYQGFVGKINGKTISTQELFNSIAQITSFGIDSGFQYVPCDSKCQQANSNVSSGSYEYSNTNGLAITNIEDSMNIFEAKANALNKNSNETQYQNLLVNGQNLANKMGQLQDYAKNNLIINSAQQIGLNKANQEVLDTLKQLHAQNSALNAITLLPGFASQSNSVSNMNGFGAKIGYKQFFGQKKWFGLRYYGFFDYGYAGFNNNISVKTNLVTYGAGMDSLFNVFQRKGKSSSFSLGLFLGFQLAGQTWTSSLNQILPSGSKINHSSFQFLFNYGFRTYFSKKYTNSSQKPLQQGFEIGMKVPTIPQTYVKNSGLQVDYMRSYSFYLSYLIGF